MGGGAEAACLTQASPTRAEVQPLRLPISHDLTHTYLPSETADSSLSKSPIAFCPIRVRSIREGVGWGRGFGEGGVKTDSTPRSIFNTSSKRSTAAQRHGFGFVEMSPGFGAIRVADLLPLSQRANKFNLRGACFSQGGRGGGDATERAARRRCTGV